MKDGANGTDYHKILKAHRAGKSVREISNMFQVKPEALKRIFASVEETVEDDLVTEDDDDI